MYAIKITGLDAYENRFKNTFHEKYSDVSDLFNYELDNINKALVLNG